MKIITSKPIIMDGKLLDNEYYSNLEDTSSSSKDTTSLSGDSAPQTTMSKGEKLTKGVEKGLDLIKKGKESGVIDAFKGLFGKSTKDTTSVAPAPVSNAPLQTQNTKNKTIKYLLIGGGVLALGVVVYFATRKKGK